MNYKNAIKQITERRKNDLMLNEQRLISALRENDELHEIDIQIRKTEQIRRKGQQIDEQQLAALKLQRTTLFTKLNISEVVPYRCAKCCDTGVTGDKPCACAINMVAAAAHNTESIDVSFEDCDLSVFAAGDRESAGHIYSIMKAFCSKFPNTRIKNILLLGKTGIGKTHLASCVANYLNHNGYSVMFVSAFGFVNRMLNYHTANIDEKLDYLSPVIDCDLLVIDDLGTESILKNVTAEYLYSVLNERLRLNRHTIITTNLEEAMLSQRYGERFCSRLFDKRISAGYVLAENDIRKL